MHYSDHDRKKALSELRRSIPHKPSIKAALRDYAETSAIPYWTLHRWLYPRGYKDRHPPTVADHNAIDPSYVRISESLARHAEVDILRVLIKQHIGRLSMPQSDFLDQLKATIFIEFIKARIAQLKED